MMKLGQHAETSRRYDADDLAAFSGLSGATATDHVPEPLVGALFSYLLGVHLPGFGTNYLKQEMRFHAAARIGEELVARVEITRLRPEKHLVDLATTCRGEGGRLICDGRALVLARDVGA